WFLRFYEHAVAGAADKFADSGRFAAVGVLCQPAAHLTLGYLLVGLCFPGKAAGFSCVRSLKPPFIPVPRVMLDSPNLSRKRSAAERACSHFALGFSPNKLAWEESLPKDDACTPRRRISDPLRQ